MGLKAWGVRILEIIGKGKKPIYINIKAENNGNDAKIIVDAVVGLLRSCLEITATKDGSSVYLHGDKLTLTATDTSIQTGKSFDLKSDVISLQNQELLINSILKLAIDGRTLELNMIRDIIINAAKLQSKITDFTATLQKLNLTSTDVSLTLSNLMATIGVAQINGKIVIGAGARPVARIGDVVQVNSPAPGIGIIIGSGPVALDVGV